MKFTRTEGRQMHFSRRAAQSWRSRLDIGKLPNLLIAKSADGVGECLFARDIALTKGPRRTLRVAVAYSLRVKSAVSKGTNVLIHRCLRPPDTSSVATI